jgi:Na+/melibiose symporter-like transporter
MLLLIQLIPSMSPWWYYGCHACTGLVNWVAVALSSLADVLPQRFRAPGIGLLMAGFMLGFSLSPILAFVLNQTQLALASFLVVWGGLIATIFVVPETLSPEVAAEARRRREDDAIHAELDEGTPWMLVLKKVGKFLARPAKEMSILNRNSFFRLVSLLAFFSGMVTSGDQLLLVYYVEERLGFTTQDVSVMFLIMGLMGLMAQGVFLKPLNECVGEKMVVAICFFVGAVDNIMYGLAQNKATIFAAVALSSLTGMAFPTISAIKANNVVSTIPQRKTVLTFCYFVCVQASLKYYVTL